VLDTDRLLRWSPWQPLQGSWLNQKLPALPGLYRIRRVGRADLDYIGQSGQGRTTLKERLGNLSGVYKPQMPYRAPHTAGPALWALRHSTGCDFAVSVVPVEGTDQWRKGLEAVAIALYRQEQGASPTVEFGRMPPGYRISSGNSAKLVAAGKRYRGGPTDETLASHAPSIAPVGPLGGDPLAPGWGGHAWSPWLPVAEAVVPLSSTAVGLYRLRLGGASGLAYIGQGYIKQRVGAHARKALTPDDVQGRIFSEGAPLECSWVVGQSWTSNNLLELENDLIAAHILQTGVVPPAQFLG
jgi:hypothetical protein